MANDRDQDFTVADETYRDNGFRRRVGYGNRAALLHIDLANAWTQPGSPFSCDNVEPILAVCNKLNAAARSAQIPVFYTTTAYEHVAEAGYWLHKIPALQVLQANSDLIQIDERVAPAANDVVIVKKRASAFPGTNLEGLLRGMSVDTLIITGLTASCCVRHTAEDGIAAGFRAVVVRDAIGDRIPGAVEYNLFDIDAKFADVVSSDEVMSYMMNSVQSPTSEPMIARSA